MASQMIPTYATRNQLRGYMLARKQARNDMRNAKAPVYLRSAARDAFNVLGMRIRTELRAYARTRYSPMPEYLRDAIAGHRVDCN